MRRNKDRKIVYKNRLSGNILMCMFIFMLGMFSCTYDTTEYKPVEVPDTVSFMNDIVPVLETGCAVSGCHDQGNTPPELTAANAYINLTLFGYVDTADAENSGLYEVINYGGEMEQYATDNDRALILKWIEQGAQNN